MLRLLTTNSFAKCHDATICLTNHFLSGQWDLPLTAQTQRVPGIQALLRQLNLVKRGLVSQITIGHHQIQLTSTAESCAPSSISSSCSSPNKTLSSTSCSASTGTSPRGSAAVAEGALPRRALLSAAAAAAAAAAPSSCSLHFGVDTTVSVSN